MLLLKNDQYMESKLIQPNKEKRIYQSKKSWEFFPTQCKQRTEFPIIVYDFPDPVCPYAKTQAL